ncbi:MAG: alpha/beta hydrolase [Oceanococcus sp.]
MKNTWSLLICALCLSACASSETVRSEQWQVIYDLPYVSDGHPNQRADVYQPQSGQTPRAAILLIHGGGWSGGERDDVQKFAKRLVRAGYVVVNAGYRFAPEFKFPTQAEDVTAAHRWMIAHSKEWGIDPDRVGVMGYSAGGHLALMLGLADSKAPHPVKAVVSGAGPADVTLYTDSPYMRRLIGEYVGNEDIYRAASPVFLASPDDPPTLLYHGTWDRLVEIGQSRAMAQALEQQGVENHLIEVTAAGHVTNFLFDRSTWRQVQAFLDRHLQP